MQIIRRAMGVGLHTVGDVDINGGGLDAVMD